MNLRELKVLVVDDNVFKTMEIKRALEYSGVEQIILADNQAEVWGILDEHAPIDLIVTDMHYPLEQGMIADHCAGFILIEKMKERGITIPVIICSSRNFICPDAFGTVWYSKQRDIRLEFRNLLEQLQ